MAKHSREISNLAAAEEAAGRTARPVGALSEANGARQKMAEGEDLKSKGLWEQPLTPRKVVGHEDPLTRRVQPIPQNHRVGGQGN